MYRAAPWAVLQLCAHGNLGEQMRLTWGLTETAAAVLDDPGLIQGSAAAVGVNSRPQPSHSLASVTNVP